jgi:hypothetical protein
MLSHVLRWKGGQPMSLVMTKLHLARVRDISLVGLLSVLIVGHLGNVCEDLASDEAAITRRTSLKQGSCLSARSPWRTHHQLGVSKDFKDLLHGNRTVLT